MEKLIELLNEYRNDGVEEYLENIKSFKIKGGHYSDLYILSKKFGFIKWLVENDKIDFNEVSKKEIENRLSIVMGGIFIETNWVLMLLSISDTPIEDLLLYLK